MVNRLQAAFETLGDIFHAQGQMHSLVAHHPRIPGFDMDAVQLNDGVQRIQRLRLPGLDLVHHGIGGSDLGFQSTLKLAFGQLLEPAVISNEVFRLFCSQRAAGRAIRCPRSWFISTPPPIPSSHRSLPLANGCPFGLMCLNWFFVFNRFQVT